MTLVEFATWAHDRGLLVDLVACARNLGMFQLHLRTTPIARRGRGHGRARSNDRVSDMMSTVRGFYRHQVRRGVVSSSVNQLLYDVVEPASGSMRWLEDLPPVVARPLHRLPRSGLSEPRTASLEEYVAMLGVAGSVRDKLLITVLALTGLRIGQVLGLRRSDMHLMANSRVVGCSCPGPHVHVVRREDNENLALSKRSASWSCQLIRGWLASMPRIASSETGCRRRACRISCSSIYVAVISAGRCATGARERSWRRSGVGPGSSGS